MAYSAGLLTTPLVTMTRPGGVLQGGVTYQLGEPVFLFDLAKSHLPTSWSARHLLCRGVRRVLGYAARNHSRPQDRRGSSWMP